MLTAEQARDGDDFSVSGGVVGGGDEVGTGGDDLAVLHNEGAEWPPFPERTLWVARSMACCMKVGFPGMSYVSLNAPKSQIIKIMAQAFLSKRVVTPEGTRAGALLVEEGKIIVVGNASKVPGDVTVIDFGNDALLPGLVDSHVR